MANNSDRLLNVVFVLDTTVSMKRRFYDSNTSILEEMNKLVEKFLTDIMGDADLCGITKVAFITFSEGVTMETNFCKIDELDLNCFKPLSDEYVQKVTMKDLNARVPGGKSTPIQVPVFEDIGKATFSRVGSGVIRALEKLDKEHARIRTTMSKQGASGSRPYVPVMVLISDGAPGEMVDGKLCPTADPKEEEAAKAMVRKRCYTTDDAKELVFPVICAIGNEEVRQQMQGYADYSAEYLDGFQFIDLEHRGDGFKELIVKLGQSLTRSISLADEKRKKDAANLTKKKKRNGKQETYRRPSAVKDREVDEDLKRTGK